jgi:hypothetical protein
MIDSIVVDDELEAEWVETLQLAGIEVHIATSQAQTEPTT